MKKCTCSHIATQYNQTIFCDRPNQFLTDTNKYNSEIDAKTERPWTENGNWFQTEAEKYMSQYQNRHEDTNDTEYLSNYLGKKYIFWRNKQTKKGEISVLLVHLIVKDDQIFGVGRIFGLCLGRFRAFPIPNPIPPYKVTLLYYKITICGWFFYSRSN